MSLRRAKRAGVRGLAPALLLALAVAGCSGSKAGIRSMPPAAALDAAAGPEALVALADSAIAAADPELARRALVRATEIAPRSAAVHAGYGRYYTAILRYRDAKAELDKAAELDPTSPEPHYWLGVAYLKAGEKEQAFRSLSRALRLDPGHPGARAAVRPLRSPPASCPWPTAAILADRCGIRRISTTSSRCGRPWASCPPRRQRFHCSGFLSKVRWRDRLETRHSS